MCQASDRATIIIVGRQAGTANAFVPVIRALHESQKQLNLVVLGISHAYRAWRDNGVDTIKVESFAEAASILSKIRYPRFMLTGTSLEVADDAHFWDWARKRSISTLAFVDSWVNYWQRFSSDPQGSTRFDLLPDKIAVIDELAADRMKEAGCPPELLLVTGHPAFDELSHYRGKINHQLRSKILPAGYDNLILFLSEPHSQTYAPDARSILGYTEEDSLILTLNALEHIGKEDEKKFCVAVKLHPREPSEKFAAALETHNKFYENVMGLVVEGPRHALVAASDVVVGMTSMLLYEATLMGWPVVSVQPDRLQKSDLIDNHAGISTATDHRQTLVALREILDLKEKKRSQPDSQNAMNFKGTDNVASYILEQSERED
jgi:hypothetical protein